MSPRPIGPTAIPISTYRIDAVTGRRRSTDAATAITSRTAPARTYQRGSVSGCIAGLRAGLGRAAERGQVVVPPAAAEDGVAPSAATDGLGASPATAG